MLYSIFFYAWNIPPNWQSVHAGQAAAIQYLQYHHFMIDAEKWSPGKELHR